MKIVEFALSMLVTVLAVALGFGCALAIATAWLRSIMSGLSRNSYNVSSVPDSSAACVDALIDGRLEPDVR